MRHIPKDTLPISHVIVASNDVAGLVEWFRYNAVPNATLEGAYTMKHGELAGQTVTEKSFVIPHSFLSHLAASGLLDGQESVLLLKPFDDALNGRPAFLLFLERADVESLGVFRSVPETIAKWRGNWSTNAKGEYFTCIPTRAAKEIGTRFLSAEDFARVISKAELPEALGGVARALSPSQGVGERDTGDASRRRIV